jgi:hypothetical protein
MPGCANLCDWETAKTEGSMATQRHSWLDRSINLFLDELGECGLTLSREHAAELITQRLQAVSSEMGLSRTTARRYLSESVLRDLARDAAMQVVDERPGADVLEQPRTIPVPLPTIGRTLAALAEAGHVRHLDHDHVAVDGVLHLISMLGQVRSEVTDTDDESIALPEAALTRGARLLEASAAMLRDGTPTAKGSDYSSLGLAQAFERDAATLRLLLADQRPSDGASPAN